MSLTDFHPPKCLEQCHTNGRDPEKAYRFVLKTERVGSYSFDIRFLSGCFGMGENPFILLLLKIALNPWWWALT